MSRPNKLIFTQMKFARLSRGYSQEKVAALTDLHQCEISLIESARLLPRQDQAQRISKVLDVPTNELQRAMTISKAQRSEKKRA